MYFFAGEVAGMIASFCAHPFDTAKTKLQMIDVKKRQSTLGFMKNMVVKNGFTSLYRGVLYPFFGFGMIFSVAFGTNGICRNYFIKKNNGNDNLSLTQLMIGGAFAGLTSSLVRVPIERVKTWSQVHNCSTIHSTKTLLTKYGLLKGLWFGLYPTWMREIPQYIVYYPIYELTVNKQSHLSVFVSGAAAGVSGWILVYPLDVAKTRIQAAPPGTYKNLMHSAKEVYRKGGYKAFWNGMGPTIYRASVLHSCTFFVYEKALNLVYKGNLEGKDTDVDDDSL